MAKLMWAILCESSFIDSETNNVSLVNVIEQYNPPHLPVVVESPLTIVALWKRETPLQAGPEAFEFRYTLVSPSGERVEPDWARLEIPGLRLRNRARIGAVPFNQAGSYTISVELQVPGGHTSVGLIELEVTAPPAQPPPPLE